MKNNGSPSIRVKLPLTLKVVEDEKMIETIKEGKWIIIAIPVKEAYLEKRKKADLK